MGRFYNGNWLIDEDDMTTRYKLIVKGVGHYGADSIRELLWTVFKHRLSRWRQGEGFKD